MRVCMVAYTFYDGDNRVMRYAETLARRGDEVEVIALRREGYPAEGEINGVRIFRIQKRAINEGSRLSYAARILRFMLRATCVVAWRHARRRYDVVHVHSVPDCLVFSALVPRITGARVLLDIHDILPEFYASKFHASYRSVMFKSLLLVEKLSAAFAHHVIVANHLWHERLIQRSVPAHKCTPILNAPDRSIFQPKPRTGSSGRFVIIYPGTLNHHQGLDIAVKAMAIVVRRMPEAELHIYGEGPSKPDLRRMAAQLGVAEHVHFHAARPLREVAQRISHADLGVVPKRSDGFGDEAFSTKILEFMALGVPVVAAETRIDRYYFDDHVVRFFRNGDHEHLAACIVELARDADARRQLVTNAAAYVRQNDWESCRQTYLDIVDGMPRSKPDENPARVGGTVPSGSYSAGFNGKPPAVPATLTSYFHCAGDIPRFQVAERHSGKAGFFGFGSIICYGRTSLGDAAASSLGKLIDASAGVRVKRGTVFLPFDLDELIENLRLERYTRASDPHRVARRLYYAVRPFLGRNGRSLIQRAFFRGWEGIPFPKWPVDSSVEELLERALVLAIQAGDGRPIPFIWFWPDGHASALMMTHDVEGALGAAFCDALMRIDEEFGIKASFQVVPEHAHWGERGVLETFRQRGFEVNVHDLNHDGRLFSERRRFEEHVRKVNEYAKLYGARGFRAGAMYRNQDWFGALDVEYDMSVPSSAHLEPQRGGCCTVMPYFVGRILELPLTTTQDYTLFHILGEYGIEGWKQQIDSIYQKHGLISFIVHPDYLVEARAQRVYRQLLQHIAELRSSRSIWVALPGEINDWWRQRSAMKLVQEGNGWRVEGAGSDRARVAYASLVDGELRYEIQPCDATRTWRQAAARSTE